MSEPKFSFELTPSGLAKQRAMRNIPKANRWIVTSWLAKAVQLTKGQAADMQKSKQHGGKKSGHLARNIGMVLISTANGLHGEVGTGVGKTQSVKYAQIQDKGGLTSPEVTDKMRKFAWAMHYKTKDDKWKGLALTKKQMLRIFIPRSRWFSGPIESVIPLLTNMLQPENALRVAEKMGGK